MKIKFIGAVGMVTGSSYLLTADNNKSLLIDFGMFQGGEDIVTLNYQPLSFDPSVLSGVLLTHAHLDHCGRFPLLITHGYDQKIYMTEATKMLAELSWIDAANIASENKDQMPLFTESNVNSLLPHIQTVSYDTTFLIDNFAITYRDAGHILGSSTIEIADSLTGKIVVFSGDLGNSPQPLLQPTERIAKADVIIMESTYGDRIHPKDNITVIFQNEINKVESSQGVLLIPAFSIDRSQEILHIINHLKKSGKVMPSTPVYFDSPMAIKVTEVYERFRNLSSDEIASHRDDPYSFPGLSMTETSEESKNIALITGPKIIIAGNGMMTGGRIWHHLINYLPETTTRLLIVGFQGDETLGHEILSGSKLVKIHGEEVKVNATVTDVPGLSAHADQQKLINWLSKVNQCNKLFLTHGEDTAREALLDKIKSELKFQNITLPKLLEEVEL